MKMELHLEGVKEAVDRVEEVDRQNSGSATGENCLHRVEERLLGIADVKELWS